MPTPTPVLCPWTRTWNMTLQCVQLSLELGHRVEKRPEVCVHMLVQWIDKVDLHCLPVVHLHVKSTVLGTKEHR